MIGQSKQQQLQPGDSLYAEVAAADSVVLAPPQPLRSRHSLLFRSVRYIVSCCLLLFLVSSFLLNCSASSDHKANGNPPFKILLARWYSSPQMAAIFAQLRVQLEIQWNTMQREGFQNWWGKTQKKLAMNTLQDSYSTLELDPKESSSLTLAQIKKKRNQLALKFHPDKSHPDTAHMSAAEKESAFLNIQRAYEVIAAAKEKEEKSSNNKQQRTASSSSTKTNTPNAAPNLPRKQQAKQPAAKQRHTASFRADQP